MNSTLATLRTVNANLDALWAPLTGPKSGGSIAVASADEAVDGIIGFWFNGITPTKIGRKNIDWTGPHHNHQEWRCQLHRFFHLGPLADSYRKTGDEKYAEAAADYLADWIAAHPSVEPWNIRPHDNILNLCIRLGNSRFLGWLGALSVFEKSPAFTPELVAKIIESTRVQLNFMVDHLAPAINWRIANADTLITAGLRLPSLPDSAIWRDTGVRVINDAYHRQVLPDGVHMERNPGYHHWMTEVMDIYARMSAAMPELELAVDPKLVAKMYDYACATLRPNGQYNGMHDCTGGRFTPGFPDSNGTIISEDTSATRGVPDFVALRRSFLEFVGLPVTPLPTSVFFPDAGQAIFNTDLTPSATQVALDATLWGGGHCHFSRNSVQLHAYGKTLLCDPGSLTYESSDPAAFHSRATRAHNTLTLNGFNQSAGDPARTRCLSAPGYDFIFSDFEGGYWEGDCNFAYRNGMSRGIWASHNRIAFFVHGLGVLVIDSMYRERWSEPERAEDIPSVEANWQFCEGGAVINENSARTTHPTGNLLALFAHKPKDAKVTLHTGERDPMRGWLPTSKGMIAAPQVCVKLDKMTEKYADFVTLLLPFPNAAPPQFKLEIDHPTGNRPRMLRLTHEDGSVDEFIWIYRASMLLGKVPGTDLVTDAGLIHLRKDAQNRITKIAAVDASYVIPHEPKLNAPRRLIVIAR